MPQVSTLSDADWIIKVRRAMRDLPATQNEKYPTDATTGGQLAGQKPFRLQHQPIVSGSVVLTAPGGPWTVDYNDLFPPGPAAGHVNINTDTGELLFPSPPAANGTLAATYQSTRFTDDQVLDALYEGMQNLYPHVWNPKTDTVSLSIISPIQFEYALDMIFGDQRTMILDLEYSPPPYFQYFRTSMWRQTMDIQNPVLIFADLPPIASKVRLTYAKTFASLGEVPSQVQHLCKYYALALLCGLQETMRTRSDDIKAQTQEDAAPSGMSLQTSSWWMQQFEQQLDRFSQNEPARVTVMNRAVERLRLSTFWTDAA